MLHAFATGGRPLFMSLMICPAYGADVQCTAHFSRAKPVPTAPNAETIAALEEAERMSTPAPLPR